MGSLPDKTTDKKHEDEEAVVFDDVELSGDLEGKAHLEVAPGSAIIRKHGVHPALVIVSTLVLLVLGGGISSWFLGRMRYVWQIGLVPGFAWWFWLWPRRAVRTEITLKEYEPGFGYGLTVEDLTSEEKDSILHNDLPPELREMERLLSQALGARWLATPLEERLPMLVNAQSGILQFLNRNPRPRSFSVDGSVTRSIQVQFETAREAILCFCVFQLTPGKNSEQEPAWMSLLVPIEPDRQIIPDESSVTRGERRKVNDSR